MTDTEDPTIGVLGLHNSKETKAILNAADELDTTPSGSARRTRRSTYRTAT
jgi:hypothetical protein